MSEALARLVFRERGWETRPRPGPTKRPLNVRIARPNEEDKLYDLLMLLAEENALAPVSEEKVRAALKRCRGPESGEPRDGVIGVIDAPDGGIAATVGIVMGTWWYTAAWHCEELWGFVHPDYRKGNHEYPKNLIDFGKWWSEQLGMPLIMGVLSTHRTMGKVRLYSRNVQFVGALFMHRGS